MLKQERLVSIESSFWNYAFLSSSIGCKWIFLYFYAYYIMLINIVIEVNSTLIP